MKSHFEHTILIDNRNSTDKSRINMELDDTIFNVFAVELIHHFISNSTYNIPDDITVSVVQIGGVDDGTNSLGTLSAGFYSATDLTDALQTLQDNASLPYTFLYDRPKNMISLSVNQTNATSLGISSSSVDFQRVYGMESSAEATTGSVAITHFPNLQINARTSRWFTLQCDQLPNRAIFNGNRSTFILPNFGERLSQAQYPALNSQYVKLSSPQTLTRLTFFLKDDELDVSNREYDWGILIKIYAM